MNCQDFEAIVVELARSRPLDAALREDGRAHARACAACAALLADQRLLNGALEALAASDAALEAPARLEASLRSAFRAHAALPPQAKHRPRWYGWVALAAACLILTLVVATRARRFAPAPQPQARPQMPAPLQAVPKSVLAQAQPPVPKPAPVRRRPRPAPRPEPEDEFVPLLYGAAPMPFESGQVVRLKLPPAALVTFGLPVNANRADPVQADVLFAQDGLARAIRFVK